MRLSINAVRVKLTFTLPYFAIRKYSNGIPFLEVFRKTTGHALAAESFTKLKQKYPNIENLSHDRLQSSLLILKKFGISPLQACHNPHIIWMNPITLDNYGEILKECGFVNIIPKHLIQYRTFIKSRTIAYLKQKGLIKKDLQLEEMLQDYFLDWPSNQKTKHSFPDSTTTILTIRLSVLENYLIWKLSITPEEFKKYCRNYLPLKHKPMSDIQESIDIAQNKINFNLNSIRRNGFIISSDPINTKLILENVNELAGLDIKEAIRIEPAILKNNYNSLLQIKDILKEYQIPEEAQKRCLKVFCMCPKTVQERLDELRNLKEYKILATNPRMLSMVIHKKKMMGRLNKIQTVRKQCFSLNHLVSSSKVFNEYISGFGNKACGRDIAILITSSLEVDQSVSPNISVPSDPLKLVLDQLRRHKFWLHAALNVVDENIRFMKQRFNNLDILLNCHLLLYPMVDVEKYVNLLLSLREGKNAPDTSIQIDPMYNSLNCEKLTDEQILSLVQYEIEKKYHFSGDGIWIKQDGVRVESHAAIQ